MINSPQKNMFVFIQNMGNLKSIYGALRFFTLLFIEHHMTPLRIIL